MLYSFKCTKTDTNGWVNIIINVIIYNTRDFFFLNSDYNLYAKAIIIHKRVKRYNICTLFLSEEFLHLPVGGKMRNKKKMNDKCT